MRESSAAANCAPATSPTTSGPNPRSFVTWRGSTGSATPMIRKPASTAVIIGNRVATTECPADPFKRDSDIVRPSSERKTPRFEMTAFANDLRHHAQIILILSPVTLLKPPCKGPPLHRAFTCRVCLAERFNYRPRTKRCSLCPQRAEHPIAFACRANSQNYTCRCCARSARQRLFGRSAPAVSSAHRQPAGKTEPDRSR
ncbi:hypothetical protein AWB73_06484 [Caballeronia turbans]|nr:hypothetical protein AWB73_06484 [Caballeronia turbans]